MSESANNNRIAKNTLLLYVRMFITTIVGLYTSRVVLQTLGVSDFGIYNVVGGIISMAAFLNAGMISASQRFLSFELGRNDTKRLSKVFCTSVNIHAAICAIAFIVAETAGLWFVNTKLNIPAGRVAAANWVFQASVISFMINVMSVPYNSAIVAHEKMSAFAYISVLDATLKLVIVYILLIFSCDKLKLYSILMVLVVIIVRACYTVYCKHHFSECKYRFVFDKKLFIDMFSFAGWSVIGNMGFSFREQLSNIILNLFFCPAVNAARGIGLQVAAHVNTFSQSFTMALNPQITKQYAAGNLEASRKLVYAGSRYTFYLLSLISIPVIINIDYILKLWLGDVPKYTGQFVIFSILASLIYALSECITKAIQATGRIKWFQIGICIIMLSELPIAWLLLKMGYPPYAAMWPALLTFTFAGFFRFWLIHSYVEGYCFSEYLTTVILRSLIVFCISYAACNFVCDMIADSFMGLIISVLICFTITSCVVVVLGITRNERTMFCKQIEKRIKATKSYSN